MQISDNIELIMPFKAEYVSIARLTVSGIANRMGFDIDTIEDIKVSVAEVCNKLVEVGSKHSNNYNITFNISEQKLGIIFCSSDKTLKNIFDESSDDFNLTIIKAFMDDVNQVSDSSYILSMSKTIERISGDGK